MDAHSHAHMHAPTHTRAQGFRAVDKELRNDLLVVCTLIMGDDHGDPGAPPPPPPTATTTATAAATAPPPKPVAPPPLSPEDAADLRACSAQFVGAALEAGLFEALLAVATSPELGLQEHGGIVRAWALSTEELDFELKLLAWKAVVGG